MRGAVVLTAALPVAGGAYGEVVVRRNWVPNTSPSTRGDAWTFKCPKGGTVFVEVDTTVDLEGVDTAAIDPLFRIFDGTGNLIGADDDGLTCAVPSACGFSCPSETNPCGDGLHTLVVRHSDVNSSSDNCAHGGGHVLRIETFDKNGVAQPASKVKLGGGPKYKVPKAVLGLDAEVGTSGPAIDDGPVP